MQTNNNNNTGISTTTTHYNHINDENNKQISSTSTSTSVSSQQEQEQEQGQRQEHSVGQHLSEELGSAGSTEVHTTNTITSSSNSNKINNSNSNSNSEQEEKANDPSLSKNSNTISINVEGGNNAEEGEGEGEDVEIVADITSTTSETPTTSTVTTTTTMTTATTTTTSSADSADAEQSQSSQQSQPPSQQNSSFLLNLSAQPFRPSMEVLEATAVYYSGGEDTTASASSAEASNNNSHSNSAAAASVSFSSSQQQQEGDNNAEGEEDANKKVPTTLSATAAVTTATSTTTVPPTPTRYRHDPYAVSVVVPQRTPTSSTPSLHVVTPASHAGASSSSSHTPLPAVAGGADDDCVDDECPAARSAADDSHDAAEQGAGAGADNADSDSTSNSASQSQESVMSPTTRLAGVDSLTGMSYQLDPTAPLDTGDYPEGASYSYDFGGSCGSYDYSAGGLYGGGMDGVAMDGTTAVADSPSFETGRGYHHYSSQQQQQYNQQHQYHSSTSASADGGSGGGIVDLDAIEVGSTAAAVHSVEEEIALFAALPPPPPYMEAVAMLQQCGALDLSTVGMIADDFTGELRLMNPSEYAEYVATIDAHMAATAAARAAVTGGAEGDAATKSGEKNGDAAAAAGEKKKKKKKKKNKKMSSGEEGGEGGDDDLETELQPQEDNKTAAANTVVVGEEDEDEEDSDDDEDEDINKDDEDLSLEERRRLAKMAKRRRQRAARKQRLREQKALLRAEAAAAAEAIANGEEEQGEIRVGQSEATTASGAAAAPRGCSAGFPKPPEPLTPGSLGPSLCGAPISGLERQLMLPLGSRGSGAALALTTTAAATAATITKETGEEEEVDVSIAVTAVRCEDQEEEEEDDGMGPRDENFFRQLNQDHNNSKKKKNSTTTLVTQQDREGEGFCCSTDVDEDSNVVLFGDDVSINQVVDVDGDGDGAAAATHPPPPPPSYDVTILSGVPLYDSNPCSPSAPSATTGVASSPSVYDYHGGFPASGGVDDAYVPAFYDEYGTSYDNYNYNFVPPCAAEEERAATSFPVSGLSHAEEDGGEREVQQDGESETPKNAQEKKKTLSMASSVFKTTLVTAAGTVGTIEAKATTTKTLATLDAFTIVASSSSTKTKTNDKKNVKPELTAVDEKEILRSSPSSPMVKKSSVVSSGDNTTVTAAGGISKSGSGKPAGAGIGGIITARSVVDSVLERAAQQRELRGACGGAGNKGNKKAFSDVLLESPINNNSNKLPHDNVVVRNTTNSSSSSPDLLDFMALNRISSKQQQQQQQQGQGGGLTTLKMKKTTTKVDAELEEEKEKAHVGDSTDKATPATPVEVRKPTIAELFNCEVSRVAREHLSKQEDDNTEKKAQGDAEKQQPSSPTAQTTLTQICTVAALKAQKKAEKRELQKQKEKEKKVEMWHTIGGKKASVAAGISAVLGSLASNVKSGGAFDTLLKKKQAGGSNNTTANAVGGGKTQRKKNGSKKNTPELSDEDSARPPRPLPIDRFATACSSGDDDGERNDVDTADDDEAETSDEQTTTLSATNTIDTVSNNSSYSTSSGNSTKPTPSPDNSYVSLACYIDSHFPHEPKDCHFSGYLEPHSTPVHPLPTSTFDNFDWDSFSLGLSRFCSVSSGEPSQGTAPSHPECPVGTPTSDTNGNDTNGKDSAFPQPSSTEAVAASKPQMKVLSSLIPSSVRASTSQPATASTTPSPPHQKQSSGNSGKNSGKQGNKKKATASSGGGSNGNGKKSKVSSEEEELLLLDALVKATAEKNASCNNGKKKNGSKQQQSTSRSTAGQAKATTDGAASASTSSGGALPITVASSSADNSSSEEGSTAGTHHSGACGFDDAAAFTDMLGTITPLLSHTHRTANTIVDHLKRAESLRQNLAARLHLLQEAYSLVQVHTQSVATAAAESQLNPSSARYLPPKLVALVQLLLCEVHLEFTDYEQAKVLGKIAVELARACVDPPAKDILVRALLKVGKCCETMVLPNEAQEVLREAYSLAVELKDVGMQAWVLCGYATIMELVANFDDAFPLYYRAGEMAVMLGDQKLQIEVDVNLGVAYLSSGEVGKAQPLLERSLKLAYKIKDHNAISRVLTNLSNVATVKGDMKMSTTLLERECNHAASINDALGANAAMNLLGVAYRLAGQLPLSLDSHLRELHSAMQLPYPVRLAECHMHLATTLRLMKNYQRARLHHRKELDIAQQNQDAIQEAKAVAGLAQVDLEEGNAMDAASCFRAAVHITESILEAEKGKYLVKIGCCEVEWRALDGLEALEKMYGSVTAALLFADRKHLPLLTNSLREDAAVPAPSSSSSTTAAADSISSKLYPNAVTTVLSSSSRSLQRQQRNYTPPRNSVCRPLDIDVAKLVAELGVDVLVLHSLVWEDTLEYTTYVVRRLGRSEGTLSKFLDAKRKREEKAAEKDSNSTKSDNERVWIKKTEEDDAEYHFYCSSSSDDIDVEDVDGVKVSCRTRKLSSDVLTLLAGQRSPYRQMIAGAVHDTPLVPHFVAQAAEIESMRRYESSDESTTISSGQSPQSSTTASYVCHSGTDAVTTTTTSTSTTSAKEQQQQQQQQPEGSTKKKDQQEEEDSSPLKEEWLAAFYDEFIGSISDLLPNEIIDDDHQDKDKEGEGDGDGDVNDDDEKSVPTIGFIPDGMLANVPFPALRPNKETPFLIEKAAVFTAGSLEQLALLMDANSNSTSASAVGNESSLVEQEEQQHQQQQQQYQVGPVLRVCGGDKTVPTPALHLPASQQHPQSMTLLPPTASVGPLMQCALRKHKQQQQQNADGSSAAASSGSNNNSKQQQQQPELLPSLETLEVKLADALVNTLTASPSSLSPSSALSSTSKSATSAVVSIDIPAAFDLREDYSGSFVLSHPGEGGNNSNNNSTSGSVSQSSQLILHDGQTYDRMVGRASTLLLSGERLLELIKTKLKSSSEPVRPDATVFLPCFSGFTYRVIHDTCLHLPRIFTAAGCARTVCLLWKQKETDDSLRKLYQEVSCGRWVTDSVTGGAARHTSSSSSTSSSRRSTSAVHGFRRLILNHMRRIKEKEEKKKEMQQSSSNSNVYNNHSHWATLCLQGLPGGL